MFCRQKPAFHIETTSELKPNTTQGIIKQSTVLQGINNLFSTDIVIQGNVKQLTGHYICVKAQEGYYHNINLASS